MSADLIERVYAALTARASGRADPRVAAGAHERAARLVALYSALEAGSAPEEFFAALGQWAETDAGAGRGPHSLQLALTVLCDATPAADARVNALLHQARQAVAERFIRRLGYAFAMTSFEQSEILRAGLELASLDIEHVLNLRWLARTQIRRGLLALVDERTENEGGGQLLLVGAYDSAGLLSAQIGERYAPQAFPPPEWVTAADRSPFLLFPIYAQEQLAGWLGLAAEPNHSEVHFYTALTMEIAGALTKARLYESQRRRAEQLNVITQVARDITAVLDLDDLLNNTVEAIRATFLLYHVMVLLVDDAGDLVLEAATGAEGRRLRAEVLRMSLRAPVPGVPEGITAWVARTGRALIVPDVAREARYRGHAALPRTRSELAVPLRIGQHVIGVLDLESDQPNGFQVEDLTVVQILADQIAVAIRNAQLFRTAEAARREAQEASRHKSQFLANMSHELRTPLNSIINFTRFVLEGLKGPVTEAQRDYLHRVHDAARHLLGLINDVLDLSKVEAGKLDLYLEDVDLGEILRGVLSTAVGLTKDKPITLHAEIAADLPHLRGDRTRLRQVALNLMANAAKFTEAGSITVRAWADDAQVYVSVRDTGVGMRAEDIPHAFEEFRQIEGSHARRYGGTGLGLPIARRFIELHGGQLWAESAPGVGATFTFSLPRVSQPAV